MIFETLAALVQERKGKDNKNISATNVGDILSELEQKELINFDYEMIKGPNGKNANMQLSAFKYVTQEMIAQSGVNPYPEFVWEKECRERFYRTYGYLPNEYDNILDFCNDSSSSSSSSSSSFQELTPTMNFTMTWDGDGSKNWLGATWENGETKELIPTMQSESEWNFEQLSVEQILFNIYIDGNVKHRKVVINNLPIDFKFSINHMYYTAGVTTTGIGNHEYVEPQTINDVTYLSKNNFTFNANLKDLSRKGSFEITGGELNGVTISWERGNGW